jgi:hypothetical protein
MAPWVTSQDVKRYALVKWDNLNYASGMPFESEIVFEAFLAGTLIPRAQGHINAFCRRDFDADYPSGIPEAVKDIAARATANMIQYLVMNRMGPLIRTGDYQVSIPDQSVLTKELRELLTPWVRRAGHVKATDWKTREVRETWDYPEKDPFLA